MRALALALLVASAAAAGCLGGEEDPEATPPPEDGAGDDRSEASSPPEDRPTNATRPALDEGTAFTFELGGTFNDLGSVNVTVASAGDDGYLLAGASPEDLREAVVFPRPWLGEVDGALNPLDDQGAVQERLFEWPLVDGATWVFDEERGLEVEAERAEVPVPGGTSAGYRIQGAGNATTVSYTYAPEIGYLTSYTVEFSGRTIHELTLTGTGTAEEAYWFERGASAATCGDPTAATPASPTVATLGAEAGRDALVVGAGSIGEGETAVQPPPSANGSQPLVVRHGAEEQWVYDAVDGREGEWELSARGQPDAAAPGTYTCVFATAVTWQPIR